MRFIQLSGGQSMYLDEKAKTLKTALIGCASTIIYYSILNMIVSPQYPWAIYPAF